ncbi:unnamed protein product [Blepharisma stoltei]|uniref:Uncharacterized protein n=1 Tax=Blepharisma stoltei TaxID=1481888 RepID=A0AAU9ILA9_9CILI|nr:unnamed protein product [Blepharisma stoltei]
MDNEILRSRFMKRESLKLPDINNRLGSFSPKPIRLKLYQKHRKQISIDAIINTPQENLASSSFITSSHLEEKRSISITPAPDSSSNNPRIRKIRLQTPVLTYEKIVMSKDLAIMAKVRKGIISELTGNRILNLTPDLLQTLKHQYLPEELKTSENSQQLLQKQKAFQEKITRHPLGTAAYAIRSLSPQARKTIKEQLKIALPQGSRFLEI